MTSKELRKKYLDFFREKGHKIIPSASLIPENDPTTLFISAGIQPLVPYFLGEPHPFGKRLTNVQKSLRTGDIDCVGDTFHHTFFEMLGNWSLGDYFKAEMIPWSFEFLTKELGIPVEKLSVTVFGGDKDAPRDDESAALWEKLGIPKERIYFLGKEDNWWGPPGKTGPCGPDSEMFYDTGKPLCSADCRPSCGCGKFIEIWNDVFILYNKTEDGKFEPLEQKNIDTGMGVERTVAVLNGWDDDYRMDTFWPIIQEIEKISGKSYEEEENKKPMRVIADHLRAAVFVIADGVVPGNVERGYVLRRLIRRAVRFGKMLGIEKPFTTEVAESVMETLGDVYPEIIEGVFKILEELSKEEERFSEVIAPKVLNKNIEGLEKMVRIDMSPSDIIKGTATYAFNSLATYGIPPEMTFEQARKIGLIKSDEEEKMVEKAFDEKREEHQRISRAGAEKRFAGGLADQSEQVVKYHTTTHLLHAALREILGPEVHQVGSNLTAERLRFDFTWPEKLTEEQIKKVEDLVNEQIEKDLPVSMQTMGLEEAKERGALAFFEQKYAEQVKVYSVSGFSKEVCGGPHTERTGVLGKFKITKEESSGAGKRRIYAILE